MATETRDGVASSPEPATPSRRRANHERWFLEILLLVFTALVYGRVVGYQFLTWDDDLHITKNPYLNPLSWSGVLHFWREPYENLYIPVSYSFWAFEAWISQHLSGRITPFDPAVFHVGNLLLHLACCWLVFRLLLRLIGHTLAAWAGALLFSLHPLQVESVAWIGESRGLLAALFSLLDARSVCAVCRSRQLERRQTCQA